MRLTLPSILIIFSFLSFSCTDVNENEYGTDKQIINNAIQEGYSNLGEIPMSAIAKMGKEEIDAWKQLGKKMYVNYSFLDSAFYKDNKTTILRDLMHHYNTILKNRDEPSYFSFCMMSHRKTARIARKIKRGVETDPYVKGKYEGYCTLWGGSGGELIAYATAKYSDENHLLEWGHEVMTKPSKYTTYIGSENANIDSKAKAVEVQCIGRFCAGYDGFDYSYYIEVNVTNTIYLAKID